MRLTKTNIKNLVMVTVAALAVSAISARADFNPPGQVPPAGNVDAPVYKVGTGQTLTGSLTVTASSGVALTGSSVGYGLQGIVTTDAAGGDAALYGYAFGADATDYAGVFYGGLGVQLASGDIYYLNRNSGMSWPRVLDEAALYGVSVTTTGELRLLGHGAGINFLNQSVSSLLTVSEEGVVNVAPGGALKVNNVDVCLSDGTNCPTPDLATGGGWTDDGATVRLTTATDKVGVGIATPGAKLEVSGGDLTTRNLKISSAVYPIIDFYSANADENNRNWRIAGVYNSYGKLEILSSASSGTDPTTTRLSIDKDGNMSVPTGEIRAKWLHSTAAGNNSIIGNLGVGTESPEAKLDAVINATPITGNSTNYYTALQSTARNIPISAGVTDLGYRIGLRAESYINSAGFAGILADQRALWARAGTYTGSTGTVVNSYAAYLETLASGGPITNAYGIYQTGANTKNYFDGTIASASGIAAGGYSPSSTHKITTPTLYAEQAQIGDPAGGLKGAGTLNTSQLCIDGVCKDTWGEIIPGGQNLLSVLNTGSDASTFTSQTTIGGPFRVKGSNNAIMFDYNGTDSYFGSLRWAGLQLGNNGENRIIAGRTAVGGTLKFYTNNTNDAADYNVTPNGTLALSMDGSGNISAPSGEVRAKWLHSTAAGDNTFAGSVGIGTTGVSNKLTVRGATSELAAIGNTATGVGTEHLLAFGDFGNYGVSIGAIQTVAAPNPQKFAFIVKTQGGTGAHTEKFRIDADGNVGIGTTDPAGYRLNVSGNLNATQLCINGTCKSSWPSISEADTLQTVTDRGSVTTQGITVSTLDTGQGANELYDMNQNVQTTDSPTFSSLTLQGASLNATQTASPHWFLNGNRGVQIRIDADQATSPGAETFQIINGANSAVLTVDESGNGTFAGTLTVGGQIDAGGNKITNLATPAAGTNQAATAAYVDAAVLGAGSSKKFQVFTSSGTWVKPSGVDTVWLTMCGGGGNGGYGNIAPYTNTGGSGGGGGAGQVYIAYPVSVSGNVDVTVGGSGQSSSFGLLLTAAAGGNGADASSLGNAAGGAGNGGNGGKKGSSGFGGTAVNSGRGGNSSNVDIGGGGGGGGTIFGFGGNGGQLGSWSGGSAGANTCAGGGGGGGGNGFGAGGAGGSGGSGRVVVEWFE